MSHEYSPSPVALTTVTCPDDGDIRSAASVNGGLQDIADAVKYLNNKVGLVRVFNPACVGFIWETTSAQATGYNVGTFWPVIGGAITSISNGATFSAGEIYIQRANSGSTAAWGYKFGIDNYLIDGATIASCVMRFQGNPMFAGSGLLPAVMPKYAIVRYTADGLISSLLSTGMVADSSATGAIYGAIHSVTFTPNQNAVVDKSTYSYAIVFWTEASTNALSGEIIYSFKITMS